MKIENKKTKKVELRVSDDDYKILKIASFSMGQSVSGMIRMVCQATINATRVQIQQGKINIEDYKTLFDDQL